MTAHRRIARTSAALLVGALVAAAGITPAQAQAEGNERIIGGSTAPAAGWPSIARLEMHFVEGGKSYTSYCGGTVVAPHWVLTAAHCTYGEASTLTSENFTVITGRTDLTATGTGESIPVVQIIRHPGYSDAGNSLGNDVALLRLATATSAPPMELAVQANVGSYASPPNVPNAAGWGWTQVGNENSASTTLKETYVPLRENGDCAAALNGVATFDPSTMVCAGAAQTNATTTCHGDSGGPLVVFTGAPARKVLWGIVSWGQPDCGGGISAFARVAAFRSFLQPVFDELSPAAAVSVPPPPPPPPPAQPVAPAPAVQSVDRLAPRLDRFVIPATIHVRAGRPRSAITIKLRSNERATVRVFLLRRAGTKYIQLSRSYRANVVKGTSRMTLPRWMWRMTPGAYRLRFRVTDAAGNTRTYHAAIRVRRG